MNTSLLIGSTAVVVVVIITFIILRRRGSAANTNQNSTQVYVGNLAYRVRERHLREVFAEYGKIRSLRVIKDRQTGRSKGFAFITYDCVKSAKASYSMHDKEFHGRRLVVRAAMNKNQ